MIFEAEDKARLEAEFERLIKTDIYLDLDIDEMLKALRQAIENIENKEDAWQNSGCVDFYG